MGGLYLLAALLVVNGVADVLSTVWPLRIGDVVWRYGAAGLLAGFNRALTGTATLSPLNQAHRLAEERMELILPQRQQLGFAGFTTATFDPCTSVPASTQAACTTWPAGFNVSASLQNNWLGDSGYQVVTVNVTGPATSQLQALVGDY